MEVKEVFSLGPPMFKFTRYCVLLRDRKLLNGAHGALKIAPLPFLSDSNTHDVAVPLQPKIRRKSDLKLEQILLQKSAMSYSARG